MKKKTRMTEYDETGCGVHVYVVRAEDVEVAPTVDAEPVRHESNTTFIATSNLDSYADRIIVGQNTLCKVYYADDPVRHGRWINKTEMRHGICDYRFDCSECSHIFWAGGVKNFNFCPNCGAKMRGDDSASK